VSSAVEFEPIELGARTSGRMATAVVSSAIVHALALAALLSLQSPDVERPVIVLPISLVSLTGGGDGSELAGGGATSTPAPEPAPPPPAIAEPTPPPPVAQPKPVAKPKPVAEPKRQVATTPSSNAVASRSTSPAGTDAVGTAGSGPGAGPGGGSGAGLGSGAASPAYGVNPEPPYPIAARRLGLEGTVVLRVVVGADGSPVSVAVLQSSGHAMLDASAADTVRAKWRFVPARRNGVPVEDTVQVPIRFHQVAG
jgi:protein TonB